MQGPTHLMASWFFAEAAGIDKPRDRRIVAWAGFMPDVDVLAYVAALVYYRFDKELAFENVWKEVHHRYTHNLAFVAATGIVAYWLASGGDTRRKLAVGLAAMVTCSLHNFFDVVGAGPTWPIYPLWPASGFGWYATWSWTIGDWQNIVLFVALVAGTLAYARFAGRSPLESFGDRADRWFTRIVREGSDARAGSPSNPRLRWIIWGAVILGALAILAPLGFNPFD